MRVVIAGGSGLIGGRLIDALLQAHHEVILLSRDPERTREKFTSVRVEHGDLKAGGALVKVIDGSDAVINLSGESIASHRWTPDQKQRILSSRIDSTRTIVAAIAQATRKPAVLLNASASGYYGNVQGGEVNETNPKGEGFLADVCGEWEMEALQARASGVRVVLLRSGVVLEKYGSALQKFLLPFRFFAGGPLGSGEQWFPWIHIQDEVNAILYSAGNEQILGPINLAAPDPVRMEDFCRVLGKVLNRPAWLSVPGFVLKLALGEMAEPLLLQGQKMIPQKLIGAGFKFQFSKLEDALRDLLNG
jgi:uncharacterized protein